MPSSKTYGAHDIYGSYLISYSRKLSGEAPGLVPYGMPLEEITAGTLGRYDAHRGAPLSPASEVAVRVQNLLDEPQPA